MKPDSARGRLRRMVEQTPTEFWNDSCSVHELQFALDNGGVGATTNPVIVGNVLKKEMNLWEFRIREMIAQNPNDPETEVAWRLIEAMALNGAAMLRQVFVDSGGARGRISIQTNPQYWQNDRLMVDQALYFNGLAPNIQVKIPVTAAGIRAIEEATYRGVNINATVCFTVPQSLAVAEAVERGLTRRESEQSDTGQMRPVCTIMIGRLDDWLKVVVNKGEVDIDPGYLEWAGIAVVKRTYALFRERNYRTRLLVGAFRNYMHWEQLVGGDLIITATHDWQRRFDNSERPIADNMSRPVDGAVVEALLKELPEFQRAYGPEGMTAEDFTVFGATRRTLRQFLRGYQDLLSMLRDFMLPDPDL